MEKNEYMKTERPYRYRIDEYPKQIQRKPSVLELIENTGGQA